MVSNNIENNDETVIDLVQIAKALWNRKWLIILVAVICAVVGFLGTRLFITPKYSSYFTAYINNHDTSELLTSVTSSDMSARATLANTAAKIANSSSVIDKTASVTGVDKKDIEVKTSVDSSSGILTVRVIMKDRAVVTQCTENLAASLKESTERIVEGSSVQYIDTPQVPDHRYSPSYFKNTIIAALIGAIIICLIIIIIELKDDTLKDSSELEGKFGIPVVGSIPDMENASNKKNGYYSKSYGGYGYSRTKADKKTSTRMAPPKITDMD